MSNRSLRNISSHKRSLILSSRVLTMLGFMIRVQRLSSTVQFKVFITISRLSTTCRHALRTFIHLSINSCLRWLLLSFLFLFSTLLGAWPSSSADGSGHITSKIITVIFLIIVLLPSLFVVFILGVIIFIMINGSHWSVLSALHTCLRTFLAHFVF